MSTPILSLAVDPKTSGANNGYSNDEIFLLITGKRNDVYHFLDWNTMSFIPMNSDHNTVAFNFLGLPQVTVKDANGNVVNNSRNQPIEVRQKYADFGKSLSEILAIQAVIDNGGRIPIPTPIEGARVYLSFLKPIFLHVDGTAPAEPADQDWKDPNFATIWDKFEFTSDDPDDPEISIPQLWSNTSCVDFVGIPLEFTLEHGDGTNNVSGPQGFRITSTANEAKVFQDTDDPMAAIKQKFISGINDALIQDVDDEDISKLVTPYRIFSPKVHGPHYEPRFGDDGDYMNNYIEFCWGLDFSTTEIQLSNFVNITSKEHNGIPTPNANEVTVKGCKWVVKGKIIGDEMVFHLDSLSFKNDDGVTDTSLTLPTKPDPSNPSQQVPIAFTITKPTSNEVLSQGGPAFTKPDFEKPPADKPEFNKNYLTEIDGDIKNQVSSAMNRSVMHLIPNDGTELWADPTQYYALNGITNQSNYKPNFYAKVLHPLCHQNKCYALPYDDKHDQQVQLNIPVSKSTDNPNIETKVKLKAIYKRIAPTPISTFTHPSNSDDFSVGIEPNPALGEDVATIWIESDKDIDIAWVNYKPERATNDANLFPSSLMEKKGDRFEVNFIPASLPNPNFKFWIKYHVVGDPGDSIFPSDVNVNFNSVISYEFAATPTTTGSSGTTGSRPDPGSAGGATDPPIATPVTLERRESWITRLLRFLRRRFGRN